MPSSKMDPQESSDRSEIDEGLMMRVQRNDTAAFAELYDRHAIRMFRVTRAICRDAGRAEDSVQESFLAIWRARASFHPDRGSFVTWSTTVARRRAIDSHRRAARPQNRTAELGADPTDHSSVSPPAEAIAREESDSLKDSLRGLPEAQAKVIILAFYGGLTHSEIAARLSLPAGTVKGRMRLGLEKLRREIELEDGRLSGT